MTGAPTRRRLPNRRGLLVIEFDHNGFAYTAGVGFFDDAGREPAEIFLTTAKCGTLLDTNARDPAIAASLLLQHGCPVETLRRALTRNGDGSAWGRWRTYSICSTNTHTSTEFAGER
jgi:ribonucleoside-diphosphate reductase alpha chain